MKAVILAAGVGSRLRPLTDKLPKCLVGVEGQSILERQIRSFLEAGIEQITVVSGYMGDKVASMVQERGFRDVRVVHNADYARTNNMYSLYLVRDHLTDQCLLANGDVVFDPAIIRDLLAAPRGSLIAAEKGSYDDESMKIVVDFETRVTAISKAIEPTMAYGNSIDVYRLSKTAALELQEQIRFHVEKERNLNLWTEVAIDQILARVEFRPFDIGARYWMEIDTLDDLEKARALVRSVR